MGCGCRIAEGSPVNAYVNHADCKFAALIADRDALAQRVKKLEGAVLESWRDVDVNGNPECTHCSQYGREDYEHSPDCIVRTIKESK